MSALQRIASYATVFILLCTTLFTTTSLYAQAPEGVNYQAVARNNSGDPLANQIISVRFSVVANSTSGTVLYQEDHSTISTNDFGLFNLIIGQGSRTGGSLPNFSAIDWSTGSKFLRVQVDAGSGFENLGTTQMLSVPYALYAKTAGNSSNSLVGGNGIIVRNDSIINDGDQSESNELINSFSLLAGNVLRITEASTDYDVDLTPIIPTTTDDQNLSFSSNGDSILIENGDGISIQFITDTIANFRSRISNNSTNISINSLAIIDTAQNIRLSLSDSASVLRALFGSGSDDQNLSFNQTGDSILIENGNGLNIQFITDTIANYDARIIANKTTSEGNTADIEGNTQAITDSTLNTRGLLADSTTALRNLFATGSDDQNLSFNQAGDSILIENGDGLNIQFITDTIVNYDARIIANKTASETNASDIITNQNEIGFLKTDVANLETSFSTDSILTLQNQDSIAILTTLLGGDNDADSTNELIDSIRFVNRTLEIYQQGSAQTISFDTLFDSRRLSLFNRTIANRDSIDAVVAIINGIASNDNDTSASNEIQQLSLVGDQLSIDDPSGTVTQIPIDLSIYNTADNLGNHQLDSNLRLGAFYVSGDGDNEGLLIDGSGNSTFSSSLRLNSDQVSTGYPLSIRAANTRVFEITDAVTNAVEWDLNFVGGNLEFNETGVGAPLTLAAGNRVGIATTSPDSTLTVNGGIKSTYFTLTDGAVDGSVLTSDANGVATWEALPATDTLNIIADADRNTSIDIDNSDVIRVNISGAEEFSFYPSRINVNSFSTFMGQGAGQNADNSFHTGFGWNALANSTGGSYNVAMGAEALRNDTIGFHNVAIGGFALVDQTDGASNVAVGIRAGGLTNGNNNTFIGPFAGSHSILTEIDRSVFIGSEAGQQETNDDRLYIENSNSTTPLIYGNFAADSVKIFGTLGVGNEYAFPDTAGTIGQILQADAMGNPTWEDAPLSGSVFEKVAGVIRDTTADYSSDFVIGSPQLDDDGIVSHDNRLFFDKSQGAFRAGGATGVQWNLASVGLYSFAFGLDNVASASYSAVSGGQNNTASFSHAIVGGGQSNTASGSHSAIGGGFTNTVSGNRAFVGGGNTNNASGNESFIGSGQNNTASGLIAVVSGGGGNTASGSSGSTVSGGQNNTAGDNNATVGGGTNNDATNNRSTIAGGSDNTASGAISFIGGGNNNTASDSLAVIGGGQDNTASGQKSTVSGGDRNMASGDESFVGGGTRNFATARWSAVSGGAINSARGGGAFVGGGGTNIAGGVYSSILGGSGNRAQSLYEVIVGSFNDTLLPGFSPLIFNSTDRLFVIGNGTADNARSNALVMLKNGNTTLNGVLTLSDGSNPFTLPNADGSAGQILQTDGAGAVTWEDGSTGGVFEKVLGVIRDTTADYSSDFVIGSPQLADDTDPTHDNRMFFDKSKGAFRAGTAELTEWDDASVGIASVAFGFNNTASGDGAFIGSGDGNTASGLVSFIGGGITNTSSADYTTIAGGRLNNVSADWGTIGGGNGNRVTSDGATIAGGQLGVASGVASFIGGGSSNRARGDYSQVSGGFSNVAQSFSEVVLGTYNDTLTSALSTNSFSATDRLLVIGNGTFGSRSNALVMLKNGNTTLNGALTLSDGSNPFTLPNSDGAAGQILQTDGSGAVTWTSLNAATTCPVGMTSVNGNICIETNERAASDWYDAAQTCTSLGYKLPTWAEWYGAATNAVLTNEINNWEWVSDGTSNTARKVGNGNVKATANDDPETGSEVFRCIYYR